MRPEPAESILVACRGWASRVKVPRKRGRCCSDAPFLAHDSENPARISDSLLDSGSRRAVGLEAGVEIEDDKTTGSPVKLIAIF